VPDHASQSNVRESYDRVAEEYAQRIDSELTHKPFDRELLDAFAAQVRGQGSVADLGCGPGMVADYLRERGVSAFGIDLSPHMVKCASARHPAVEFRTGDFTQLDAADDAWIGIVALYSLVHLSHEQVPTTLREFYRVLQPGGLLLLAFHVGRETRHATDWWGKPVDLDFVFFETTDMLSYVWGAGFDTEFHVERDPYPDAELQTQRGYILARKPNVVIAAIGDAHANAASRDAQSGAMARDAAGLTTIYRIVSVSDWQKAQQLGEFRGSALDQRDGFIHFSAADQVAQTAAKHYAGKDDLLLLHVPIAALPQTNGTVLKWEVSRGGALFPHLYGALPVTAVQRAEPLQLGPDGAHSLPVL
jgi:uncharacterized protein (DUF952 family)/ubiquinone/menaquinone biosynthesis C-methylase UbiE